LTGRDNFTVHDDVLLQNAPTCIDTRIRVGLLLQPNTESGAATMIAVLFLRRLRAADEQTTRLAGLQVFRKLPRRTSAIGI